MKHADMNKRKSVISSCSLLSKGAKVSLSRLKFLAMRETYLRPQIPPTIARKSHSHRRSEDLTTSIKRRAQDQTRCCGMLLRNAYKTAAPYHPATSHRINNARRDPLVRSNRIWNLRSRPDTRCGISSDGLDPIYFPIFNQLKIAMYNVQALKIFFVYLLCKIQTI